MCTVRGNTSHCVQSVRSPIATRVYNKGERVLVLIVELVLVLIVYVLPLPSIQDRNNKGDRVLVLVYLLGGRALVRLVVLVPANINTLKYSKTIEHFCLQMVNKSLEMVAVFLCIFSVAECTVVHN